MAPMSDDYKCSLIEFPRRAATLIEDERNHMRSKIGAWILIILGVLFLAANLGWIPRLGPLLAQWWPVILIVVGISMLVRR